MFVAIEWNRVFPKGAHASFVRADFLLSISGILCISLATFYLLLLPHISKCSFEFQCIGNLFAKLKHRQSILEALTTCEIDVLPDAVSDSTSKTYLCTVQPWDTEADVL